MYKEGFFKKGIQAAAILSILLLTGVCGRSGSPVAHNVGDAVQEPLREKEVTAQTGAVQESSAEFRDETESVILTQDEQEIGVEGNILTYGGLIVELPEGIEAKLIEPEDNGNLFSTGNILIAKRCGQIFDLCGAQEVYAERVGFKEYEIVLDLPPRVRLLHYTAAYDNEMALIYSFFDLLPEAAVYRMYADKEKGEYAYRLEQDGYLFFALVRNEEIYLAQELEEEKDCGFDALLTDKVVRWKDDGSVGVEEEDAFSYRKIVPEEGVSFLYVYKEEPVGRFLEGYWQLYREGDFENPFQTFRGELCYKYRTCIEDVNFDGCMDMVEWTVTEFGAKIFLWNPSTKAFELAQSVKEVFPLLQKLPETRSYWAATTHHEIPEEWKPVWWAEALWQWEGNRLVKKRECVVSIVEERRRIWAYEGTPDQLLFDETFSMEEWEEETKGRVQSLYEQFYEGMAPKEMYAQIHTMEGERKLPQKLLDEMENVMAAGKDAIILSYLGDGKESAVFCGTEGKYADLLATTISGRKLSQEEVLALAGRDMAVRQQVQRASRNQYQYTLLEMDCDNDGWADQILELDGQYIGGTSGTVNYVFLKGQPDGSYVETDSFYEQRENFQGISYEGKNYLCYADFDSDRMIYNGYTVQCYEDGKRVEEATIHMVPERYEIRQVSVEPGYEDLVSGMAEKCDVVKETLDKGQQMTGGAEQAEGENYLCDLDNDGKQERYEKSVWWLSMFDGGAHMEFRVKWAKGEKAHRGIGLLSEQIESSTDTPMALWVDAYEGKNIVQVLYMTGLDDHRIEGYLVEENDYSQVYEIQVDAVYKVEQERRAVF